MLLIYIVDKHYLVSILNKPLYMIGNMYIDRWPGVASEHEYPTASDSEPRA